MFLHFISVEDLNYEIESEKHLLFYDGWKYKDDVGVFVHFTLFYLSRDNQHVGYDHYIQTFCESSYYRWQLTRKLSKSVKINSKLQTNSND